MHTCWPRRLLQIINLFHRRLCCTPPQLLLDTTFSSTHCRGVQNFSFDSFQALWPAEHWKVVESFVRACQPARSRRLVFPLTRGVLLQIFQALDVIPRSAGYRCQTGAEIDLVAFMLHIFPQKCNPAFCAAVLRKWRSEAVSSVLRARGTLQIGVAQYEQHKAEYGAWRRHRQTRAARLRPPFLCQDGEDGQRVCGVLRLSLCGVLLHRAPGSGLDEAAQEDVPEEAGCTACCGGRWRRRAGNGKGGGVREEGYATVEAGMDDDAVR